MTVSNNPFSVNSVAIIGAGPSGIASIYEFTRITKSGKSLFGEKNVSQYTDELKYKEVVAFERNATVGGVWSRSVFHENSPDPYLPDLDVYDDLSNPENIYKRFDISSEFEEELAESSFDNPVIKDLNEKSEKIIKHQWRGSGAYKDLFTNVTNQFMHYSFAELEPAELDKLNTKYKNIPMHQSAADVSDYLEKVVDDNDLRKHIRLNSNVERVRKLSNGKWEILVSSVHVTNDGAKQIKWYRQLFDAVILASGKTVPYVPQFKGLPKFIDYNKDVTIRLAKSIKNPEFLQKKKKILIVGTSVSAVDILQYAFPRNLDNSELFLSRSSPTAVSTWVTNCSYAKGIINKPLIEEFLPEEKAVKFVDGSIEYGFDAIIFATGYQVIYPFIEKELVEQEPKLLDFYLYTFSIADKTLALVGNTYTAFFFNRAEAQAAALASIWGNFKQLPDVEEQLRQSQEKLPLIAPLVTQLFIDPLINLTNRPHPFSINKNKSDHTILTAVGSQHVQDLWVNIRDGKVDPLKVLEEN